MPLGTNLTDPSEAPMLVKMAAELLLAGGPFSPLGQAAEGGAVSEAKLASLEAISSNVQ